MALTEETVAGTIPEAVAERPSAETHVEGVERAAVPRVAKQEEETRQLPRPSAPPVEAVGPVVVAPGPASDASASAQTASRGRGNSTSRLPQATLTEAGSQAAEVNMHENSTPQTAPLVEAVALKAAKVGLGIAPVSDEDAGEAPAVPAQSDCHSSPSFA